MAPEFSPRPAFEAEFDAFPLASAGLGGDAPQATTYLNADSRAGAGDNGKTSFTIDQAAAQLTRDSNGWGGFDGHAATVTYAYRADAPATMPSDIAGFSQFNVAQITQAELALKAWSDVANITFQRVGTGTSGAAAYSDNATILLGNYSSGEDGSSAFTYYPGSRSSFSNAGDVWVNNSLSYNANPVVQGYGGMVLVHELGHAIGLSHPSDYNAAAGVTLTYGSDASYFEDSRQYSVMSYFGGFNTGANLPGYAAAPLLDDIAAAQQLYGANMTTRTGDTVYGFHSNTDEPWLQTSSEANKLQVAIWDAGGNDTLDVSGYYDNQKIDLRQGFFSDVGGQTGNVAIAKGADIENAISGTGSDSITGNGLNNSLAGGGGDDTIMGGAGDDTLSGGSGDDLLNGEAGNDVAVFSGPSGAYHWLDLDGGAYEIIDTRTGSPDGSDTVQSVEGLKFADATLQLDFTLPTNIDTAIAAVLRADSHVSINIQFASTLDEQIRDTSLSTGSAVQEIVAQARATSSVATLAYEFFTGRAPYASGMDYLVSPTGGNPNNLNAPYYQTFSLENRYINFGVNLGKLGEGAASFQAQYGSLDLFDATRQAYATIFGSAPSDAKLHDLLDPSFQLNGVTMSRAEYFAYYGQDGADGIGAKAAMVGWLLGEAAKADLGVYAQSNDAFLTDVALHDAPFGVDFVGLYDRPEFIYHST